MSKNIPTDPREQKEGVASGALEQESTGGNPGTGNDRDDGQRLGHSDGGSEGDAPTTDKF